MYNDGDQPECRRHSSRSAPYPWTVEKLAQVCPVVLWKPHMWVLELLVFSPKIANGELVRYIKWKYQILS
jgi:hypothetical protein